jgi:hypothetical protein
MEKNHTATQISGATNSWNPVLELSRAKSNSFFLGVILMSFSFNLRNKVCSPGDLPITWENRNHPKEIP